MSHHRSLASVVTAVAKIAIGLAALSSTALAIVVENRAVKIGGTNGNKADFGSGGHSGGLPNSLGNVRWDYSVVNGLIVAKARVTGTLYLDDFFGGQVRINIQFLDLNNNLIANDASITITSSAMPFSVLGAADSNHQMPIDVNREASNLHRVVITIRSLGQNSSNSKTVTVLNPVYKVSIGNIPTLVTPALEGVAFGGSPSAVCVHVEDIDNYLCDLPTTDIQFVRTNGVIQGVVLGTLYWNHGTPGQPEIRIIYQDLNGNELTRERFSFFAPGGDPDNAKNHTRIASFSPALGTLWQITLVIGMVPASAKFTETGRRVITFDGGPSTGIFDLAPSDATVAVHERQNYAFTWTLPDPLNWHDLNFLQLRIRNGDDTLLWMVFDEATHTFALRNEATGELGQAFPAGSHHVLQTPKATLHLDETSVVGSGPTGPSVTLNLSLSVKPQAAGDSFAVEVAATDDAGNQGKFELAGTLTVTPKQAPK